jgi:hypothetical protein
MRTVSLKDAGPCAAYGVKVGGKVFIPDSAEALYLKCVGNPLPLGDYVEKITKATGIKWAVEKVLGNGCGCGKRKQKLNELGAAVAKAIA